MILTLYFELGKGMNAILPYIVLSDFNNVLQVISHILEIRYDDVNDSIKGMIISCGRNTCSCMKMMSIHVFSCTKENA